MIQINDLGFTYGKGENAGNYVLRNISMDLKEGRIYGLLGENGVGKTTLLTLLCGLKKPQKGSIDIDGHDPFRREPSLLSDAYYLSDEVAGFNMNAIDYAGNYGKFYRSFAFFSIAHIVEQTVDTPGRGKAFDQSCGESSAEKYRQQQYSRDGDFAGKGQYIAEKSGNSL